MEIEILGKSLAKNFGTFHETVQYVKSCLVAAKSGSNKIDFFEFDFSLSADEVTELMGFLYENFLREGEIENTRKQRDLGIYFTNGVLSDLITRDALNQISYEKAPKFLEPAAGMGAFVFSYIRNIFSYHEENNLHSHISKQEIIDSVYVVEKDKTSAEILFWLINSYLAIKYDSSLIFSAKNMYIGDALINKDSGESEDLVKKFQLDSPFDLVITNPPYRLLKASHSDTDQLREEIASLKKLTNAVSYYDDITGVSNIYKLFVCKILNELVDSGGVVGLVIPRSLLTDFQSAKLRKKLIASSKINNIYDVPEGSQYFKGIGQAFSLFTLVKGGITDTINLTTPNEQGEFCRNSPVTSKPIDFYMSITDGLSLIPLSIEDANFLENLSKFPRVKDCPQIVNLRGELDITLDKEFICDEATPYGFVQGIDIGLFSLKQTRRYVYKNFLPRRKDKWIKNERIACQQISNTHQERRLKWSYIPSGYILGNSCNFIAIDSDSIFQDKDPVSTSYLLAVFNSFFMNRWFKLLSANNHVSNNEIANMPFVIPEARKQVEIEFIVRKLLIKYTPNMHLKLEEMLCEVFEIDFDARKLDRTKGIV